MFSSQPTGFTFGALNTTFSSSFSSQPSAFGTPQTAPTTTASSFNFTGFGTQQQQQLTGTQQQTGFGITPAFGATNTGFGTSALSTAQQPSTGFGMFNNAANNKRPTFVGPTQQPTLTLTLNNPVTSTAATTSSTTTFTGLGGAPLPSSNGKPDDSSSKNKSYRDAMVPPELIPLIENMKKFLEKQKQIRDENAHEHFYLHPILEIGTTIEDILRVRMNKLDIQIQKNAKSIEFLKKDTNKLLANGELVYRISRLDLPLSNSAEVIAQNNFINAKTHQYFMEVVENCKTQMAEYSEQIQTLKSHCATSNDRQQYSLDEINKIIRKQHENFVTLASKVYLIHEHANKLRAEAANNKSTINNDNSPVEELPNNNRINSAQNDPYGPTPFLVKPNSSIGISGDMSTFSMSSSATNLAPQSSLNMFNNNLMTLSASNAFSFGKNKKL